MAFPFHATEPVFVAGTALTETKELEAGHVRGAGSVQISFTYTGHSGLVDIQGRLDPLDTWRNLPYVIVGDGALTATNDQVSNTTVTGTVDYLVTYPMPYMRVVMTRSAGSLAAFARYFSEPFGVQLAGGTVDTELPAAAAASDTDANTASPSVRAFNMYWDSAAQVWKRQRGAVDFQAAAINTGMPITALGVVNASTALYVGNRSASRDGEDGNYLQGVGLMGFNGTAWDRLRINANDLLQVDTSNSFSARVSVTRPANATPYTANDVLGATAAALEFTSMGLSAGRVLITSASLEVDVDAVPAGMTNFLMHLYGVTPPSALADNAAHDIPSGDRASYLGFIDLGAPVDRGSTLYVEANAINKQVKLAGTSLFGYLTTVGGFTPAGNSEVYVVTLHSVAV